MKKPAVTRRYAAPRRRYLCCKNNDEDAAVGASLEPCVFPCPVNIAFVIRVQNCLSAIN